MKVSGQLQVLAALPPEKKTIEKDDVEVSKPV
jgi:hypothetical protein